MKKNISRIPLDSDKIKESDVFGRKDLKVGGAITVTLKQLEKFSLMNADLDDYTFQIEERVEAYLVNCMPSMIAEKGDNQLIKMQKKLCSSTIIFQKEESTKVSLDDFDLKKIIGRGSFGKVFLVQNRESKKFYAMKSMRKDVVINKE